MTQNAQALLGAFDPTTHVTGSDSNYYLVHITDPKRPELEPYYAECEDLIEALDMRFAEANVFKAIWRRAAARLGNGKPGSTSKYDAEKMVYYSQRELAKDVRAEKILTKIAEQKDARIGNT